MKPESPSHTERDSDVDSNFKAEDFESGIDLNALLHRIWEHRVRVVLLLLAGLLGAVAIFFFIFLFRPTYQEARLSFQLLFDGAGRREFPDHTPFNPADIVSTSVLAEVYRRNPIQNYIAFERFKSSFSVLESGSALERLQREYQERLSNRSLTPADRKRIEDEFNSRADALKSGEFTIVASLGKGLQRWPTVLSGKVLNDVLNVWADQSRSRGVFEFNVAAPSRNVLPRNTGGQEPLLLLNHLRITASQILHDIELLSKVPGSRLIRIGENQISLGTLQARIEDLIKFQLAPAEAYTAAAGALQNRSLVESFLQEQVAQLNSNIAEFQSRADVRKVMQARKPWTDADGIFEQSSSDSPSPLMTQVTEGFLERLMGLAKTTSDLAFRQRMAKETIEESDRRFALSAEQHIYSQRFETVHIRPANEGINYQAAAWTDAEFQKIMDTLGEALDDLQLLNAEISRTNLQPSMIFNVVDPVRQQVLSEISMRSGATGLAIAFIAFAVAIILLTAWRGDSESRINNDPSDRLST